MGRRKSKRLLKPKIKNKIHAAEASSSVVAPPWIELPRDVTANILKRVGADEILKSAHKVCTTWWKVCQDPAMWRVIDLSKCSLDLFEEEGYRQLCRRAVDLSQGQLVDLAIDSFADDELINYIADRSSILKRIALGYCYQVLGIGLSLAVKKLPELEELHLIMMANISSEDVEEIGMSCPKLKSFSYIKRGSQHYHPESSQEGNFYALAIGNSMPNLHHLGLFALQMQNGALEIILDGCPNLESLDIRQCLGLNLEGDLGKRCREQIKDLRLPSEPASDGEWPCGGPYACEFCYDQPSDYDDDDFYQEYDGYESYDDYCSPLAYGFFGDDAGPHGFQHDDYYFAPLGFGDDGFFDHVFF